MDKKNVKVIFIIPFYDRDIVQLGDTIDSIKFYMNKPFVIICVNDCRDKKNIKFFEEMYASDNVINFVPRDASSWPHNTYGALFCKKYQGLEFALKKFNCDFLIFMDTDALLTGSSLVEYVEKYFKENGSDVGIIGSYKERADGRKRTRWQWALYILYQVYLRKSISRKSIIWKEWIPAAKKNNYKLGQHVLGGAFIVSSNCIKRIVELYPYDVILKNEVYCVNIGDDVLFSMLSFASGFKIGDFGRPNDPMAVAQKYLPISKEDIVRKEKQIIHSVKKGFNGENEKELRTFFKSLRK